MAPFMGTVSLTKLGLKLCFPRLRKTLFNESDHDVDFFDIRATREDGFKRKGRVEMVLYDRADFPFFLVNLPLESRNILGRFANLPFESL